MQLPLSEKPLITLAEKTAHSPAAVRSAIDNGVFNFILEAYTAFASTRLQNSQFLDGKTATFGLGTGLDLIKNIEEEFLKQDDPAPKKKK